jgi:hypothetical protein
MREQEHADLFLIYVPEDRLPIAAVLAVELAKRRVRVAFSQYEVESEYQLTSSIVEGLALHGAGVLLLTSEYQRRGWAEPPAQPRFMVFRLAALGHTTSVTRSAEDLARWLSTFDTKSGNSRW